MPKRFLITGGAGFIGSATVRHLISATENEVLVLDKLTYAGNLDSLSSVAQNPRYHLRRVDIGDARAVRAAFADFQPDVVMHLAAETHVDRSIDGPAAFIQTNVVGTFVLLEAALDYWRGLPAHAKTHFRFHHISTDEVFGSLGETGHFSETTPYDPSSPYSASKASSDHLVRAWHRTYGLPIIVTNCSNNYGPYQFPEKLIPLMIINAVERKPLPVYGTGSNVRDWLHVEDHVQALIVIIENGKVGDSYNIGGNSERTNHDVVKSICMVLDEMLPGQNAGPHHELITFVADRPGHDLRYAINPAKVQADLRWAPQETFESGLRKTVAWYLDNREWWTRIRSGIYQGERLGMNAVQS